MSDSAARLCDDINRQVSALSFSYAENDEERVLSVDGRPPIRFPVAAGGGVHGGSAAWVSKKHQDGAIHEPGLVAALVALARSDHAPRTVLDVGALYGYVSLVARSLFPAAEVHAFEANPKSYQALQRNVEANRGAFGDSVRAHHCALADISEPQVRFRVHRMRLDADAGDDADDAGEKGFDHRIDVWSLDDFCRERALAPDLVKVDVEGYQAKIVPGAMGVIAEHRPLVLIEFDAPGAANDFGVANRDVIRPLLDLGYRLLWGRHRTASVRFRPVGKDELTDRHEINSLGILVP